MEIPGAGQPQKKCVMADIAIKNGPFIVDLPMNNMVIFHRFVSLPEGIHVFGDINILLYYYYMYI